MSKEKIIKRKELEKLSSYSVLHCAAEVSPTIEFGKILVPQGTWRMP